MRKRCQKCGDLDNGHSLQHCITYLQIRLDLANEQLSDLKGIHNPVAELLQLRDELAAKDVTIYSQAKNLRELRECNKSLTELVMRVRNRGGLTKEEKELEILNLSKERTNGKRLTHEQISRRVGCSREYVSRYLASIKRPHSTTESAHAS